MGKSAHYCLSELRHELAECEPLREISTQRKRVHKVTDYIREFYPWPASGWRAHHDLLLTGNAVQQNLKACQQCHEESGSPLGAEFFQLLGQLLAECKRQ